MAGAMGDSDWLPQTGDVLLTFSTVSYTGGVSSSDLGLGSEYSRIIEVSGDITAERVFDLLVYDAAGAIKVYRSERIPGLYPQEYVKRPNGVGTTLRAGPGSGPIQFNWSASPVDAEHSEASYYIIYLSDSPDGGFLIGESTDQTNMTLNSSQDLEFYKIVAANVAGTSGDGPAP